VVTSVEHFVVFLGHAVFLILTRPNAHNKNFPYHVRTTQIGILEAMEARGVPNASTNGGTNGSTPDAFSRGGAYGVSDQLQQPNMDVFTVEGFSSRSLAPPPYSTAPTATTTAATPPWAAASRRKNSATAAVNGVSAHPKNGSTAAAAASTTIYDPNADEEDDEEQS